MIKLSVLDQSPIRSGSTAAVALQETLQLARACDAMGYHRYWLAEHHASDALAGCAPEVLLGRLGAETSRIRIGSGGVMLPHYSPFKVAENFKLLQTLYPGRVDLGVGRAPGTDPFTAAALRYGSRLGPQHFPQQVADLQALLNEQMGEPYGRIMLMHLTIIFGGWIAMAFDNVLPALMLLIGLKIAVDVSAHLKQHKPKSAKETRPS